MLTNNNDHPNETGLAIGAKTVLNEILEALKRLRDSGEEYTIFIDKTGLSQDERQAVKDYLGTGGIKINYHSTDEPVEWLESGISGIWFGVFYNQNQKPLVETIEICRFPQVASAQTADIALGYTELSEKLK